MVISERLWKRRFGGDPAVLKRPLLLDGDGVYRDGRDARGLLVSRSHRRSVAARRLPARKHAHRAGVASTCSDGLKPDVTAARADRELKQIHAEMTRLFPRVNTGWSARVIPLHEELTGEARPALFVLIGAVACVLLIACANVANLPLARATTRQREMAVRAALGAARGRLMRQMMAESLLLAFAGGVAGLALAWWAVRAVRLVVAERVPIARLESVTIDGTVLMFTHRGVRRERPCSFGLMPALTASGAILSESLKEGGRTGSAARGARTRGTFVVAEIALALVLLVGAGLLVRSFAKLLAVDPGFDLNTVSMRISLPASRYSGDVKPVQFYQQLFDRIDALPGVRGAGAISFSPLATIGAATSYSVVDQPAAAAGAGARHRSARGNARLLQGDGSSRWCVDGCSRSRRTPRRANRWRRRHHRCSAACRRIRRWRRARAGSGRERGAADGAARAGRANGAGHAGRRTHRTRRSRRDRVDPTMLIVNETPGAASLAGSGSDRQAAAGVVGRRRGERGRGRGGRYAFPPARHGAAVDDLLAVSAERLSLDDAHGARLREPRGADRSRSWSWCVSRIRIWWSPTSRRWRKSSRRRSRASA